MATAFSDISVIADGPFGTTNIDFTNNTLTFSANAIIGLTVNSNGSVVAGTPVTTTANFFVNGSMASNLANSAVTSGTVNLDFSTANNFKINLSSALTLGAPLNTTIGQSGIIFCIQPPAGSCAISYNSVWKWPNGIAPINTVTANAVDAIAYFVLSTSPSIVAAQFISNFS